MTTPTNRLSDMTTNWVRTRWAALSWFYRILFALLVAINATLLIGAVATATWSAIFTALSGLALAYILADWQYWEKVGRVSQPLADFGYVVARDLHRAQERGEHEVTIRMDGSNWVVVSNGPQ